MRVVVVTVASVAAAVAVWRRMMLLWTGSVTVVVVAVVVVIAVLYVAGETGEAARRPCENKLGLMWKWVDLIHPYHLYQTLLYLQRKMDQMSVA